MTAGVGAEHRVVQAKVRAPRARMLPRERLDAVLGQLWSRRLGLVVAPAGSGKTTVLAGFAAAAAAPVAWYRAESWDGGEDVCLRHLEAALTIAMGELPGSWASVGDAVHALEAWPGERALLVVDDLHALDGTPAEATLARLVEYAPAWLTFAFASRAQPRLDVSRLRVSGDLLELGGDDLRYRSWEVERLFRDFYRSPLPPVELAELARTTGGWAAGLQLFHLATRGKPPADRRKVLAGLAGGSRLVREYLTGNVLAELPSDLRRFLVETSVLGRLNARICDEFLGRDDCARMLDELERRQLFTQSLEDGDYRYHEVLRAHLEGMFAQLQGEAGLRERHRVAAAVLERAGALPEALHAFCRAEDWPAVGRLLGESGEELVRFSGAWIDALPASLLEHDPWLLLASARRHRADGLWPSSVAAYVRAERGFSGADAADIARRERQAVASWLEPGPARAGDLLGLLRGVTRHGPAALRARSPKLDAAGEALAAGLAALAAGMLGDSRRAFERALAAPEAAGPLAIGAGLGLGVAGLLGGDLASVREVAGAQETSERTEQPFLARMAQASLALEGGPDGGGRAAAVRFACRRLGDEWGAALAGLLEGLAWACRSGEPQPGLVPMLEEVAAWLEAIDAPAMEAWARAVLAAALAASGRPGADTAALRSERLANANEVEGAKLFAYLALATADPGRRAQYIALADAARAVTGIAAPGPPEARPAVEIRLFGGFAIEVQGAPCELSGLKPRVRALLRLLASRGGRPLHRDAIQAALWPDADSESGARNVQVAVSSLRQALEPGVARAGFTLLVRDGDAYRLVFGSQARCDLATFEHQVADGRRAGVADPDRALECYERALGLYAGELLPEDGAADWAVESRERCRGQAVEAAQSLAQLRLARADAEGAAAACALGLRADRYHDPLWRLLIEARERAGDRGAARRARSDYESVLQELGVTSA